MRPTSVSFVVPMYNEKDAIKGTIKELRGIAERISGDYEIIISDDGSTDGSGAVADSLAAGDGRIKVVHLAKNTKFGGALKAGLEKASKEVIIYTDSDLPVEEKDISGALGLLGPCDIVSAYSMVKKGETLKRVIMSKVYNGLIQLLFRTGIKDINSGFKIYKNKAVRGLDLISKSPFVDVEIFVKAGRRGFSVKQYPVLFKNREKGASHISRPSVILRTLFDMFRFRLLGG